MRARAGEPYGRDFEGVLPNLRRRYEEGTWAEQEELERYRSLRPCPDVPGSAAEAREPGREGEGPHDPGLREPADLRGARRRSTGIELTDREAIIAERILREIQDRLRFLDDVGVGYLTLGRSAATLSGGEGQRIRLATQIGANLTGVLYVLDEPSIGLHQRDNRKLLGDAARGCAISATRSSWSSTTRRRSARPTTSIDLGPGAGEHGGQRDLPGDARRA